MAAPKGNRFWELASKHGRDRLFEKPEDMWQAACEYFTWAEDNPFHKAEAKVVQIGDFMSKVEIANIPVMRPFTIQGLTRYLNCNVQYFNDFEKALKPKDNEIDKEFSVVITRIRETIYQQKFSGAASGFLNANIIARDLGLRDKADIDHTTGGEKMQGVTKEDIERIAKKINSKAK